MDPKEIRELIELISRSSFAEFELEGEGFKLKLVKQQPAAGVLPAPVTSPSVPRVEPQPTPAPPQPPTGEVASAAPLPPPAEDGLVELYSPIVGTFFNAPGPDAPPFVEVGSAVKKGQVLCIVEAMKVMNEIESEIDAVVGEILVSNGQPVEFGDVLLRLRPI